jgi:hypothetical protein
MNSRVERGNWRPANGKTSRCPIQKRINYSLHRVAANFEAHKRMKNTQI